MSKSLKYVTEFEFPSDKGYTGSCAKEPAKAYAKGGSCSGYAKGGSCGDSKMMKAKGGKVVERATGEKYPSREAMVRHESLETPRMQREEVVKRQVVKAPQSRRRGEPMIAPKERGETLLAKRQQQGALGAIAQANTPGQAMMKKGGSAKESAKIGKVMNEFKAGDLHSGSKKGPEVTSKKQALAIAMSEAKKASSKKG
jgi:hypothetical protein